MKTVPRHPPSRGRAASRQRGVVMLFALITLAIMMVAAVAMARSFNSSLFAAGNIGFKRDLQNQSDLALADAMAAFRAPNGALRTPDLRKNDLADANYSATMLPSNAQGIPTALVDRNFPAGNASKNDKTFPGGTVRYLIDRLCSSAGDERSMTAGNCVLSNTPKPAGGGWMNLQNADSNPLGAGLVSAAPRLVTFRVSVMVTGPRNTQSFFQSTVTSPSTP